MTEPSNVFKDWIVDDPIGTGVQDTKTREEIMKWFQSVFMSVKTKTKKPIRFVSTPYFGDDFMKKIMDKEKP